MVTVTGESMIAKGDPGAAVPSATGGVTGPWPVRYKSTYPPAGIGVAAVCGVRSTFRAAARLSVVRNKPGSTTVSDDVCDGEARSARELTAVSLFTTRVTPAAGMPDGIWKLICVGLT